MKIELRRFWGIMEERNKIIMEKMEDLEKRIVDIEARNIRVEDDKKWETSILRKVLVAVLTYIVVCFFLYLIKAENIFVASLVPVIGFWLSTASLNIIKKMVK